MPLVWNDGVVKREVAQLAWDTASPNIADSAVDAIKEQAPVDTGELRDSIYATTVPSTNGLTTIRIIANSDHSLVVERGHDEIFAETAQALHWISKLGGSVFAKSSAAVPANPFIERGLRSIGLRVVENE